MLTAGVLKKMYPFSLNTDLSLPILLSIVPAARAFGHEHKLGRRSEEAQVSECTIVLLNSSRHTKKVTTS